MRQFKRFFLFALLFSAACACAFAQTAVTLAQAISSAAGDISARLEGGTRVAVLNFSSSSETMSDHVLAELNDALVNEGSLTVVARQNLSVLQQELNFQMSGDVSDETAQSIGRMLGVQMIVSGSLGIVGSDYRFRVQALEVETAAIRYSRTQNIMNDNVVQSLMRGSTVMGDFTPAQRIGASALNLVFGLGSFVLQNDRRGGTITALFEGLGVVAVIASQALYAAYVPEEYDYYGNPLPRESISETYMAYPFYIGLAAYAGGAIYGIIRAQSFHRPGSSTVGAATVPWDIALVPGSHGDIAVKLSYTMRW